MNGSLTQGWTKHNHREVDVVWVSRHELLDLSCCLAQEFLFCASSMINRTLFESIEFINPAIFGNKGYEMSITSSFNARNSLVNCLFMFIMNLFTILEDLSSCFTVLTRSFFVKFVKETSRSDNIWVFFFRIQDYVEQSYWSASIDCVLFHVENVTWYFLRF